MARRKSGGGDGDAAPPRRRRPVRAVLIVLLVLTVVAVGLYWLRDQKLLTPEGCSVKTPAGEGTLEVPQAANAATIAAVAHARGLPDRAVTISLATAMQESKIRNLAGGDRDSVGLFQQRPSQGWGTVQQIMDPVYATNKFLDGLVKVPGYTRLPLTDAAQQVQKSGYPQAYAKHETKATLLASALTGREAAALNCVVRDFAAPDTDEGSPRRPGRGRAGHRRDGGGPPGPGAGAERPGAPRVRPDGDPGGRLHLHGEGRRERRLADPGPDRVHRLRTGGRTAERLGGGALGGGPGAAAGHRDRRLRRSDLAEGEVRGRLEAAADRDVDQAGAGLAGGPREGLRPGVRAADALVSGLPPYE